MKVIAYSLKEFEKEFLARANQTRHEITLISNRLTLETAGFAEGTTAVLVFGNDDLSAAVIHHLAGLGVKYIAARSISMDHIDSRAMEDCGIKFANVLSYSPRAVAEHVIGLVLALNRHLVEAELNSRNFDFRTDHLVGFNLFGKTVGIIGTGKIGTAVAAIFKGFGCRVLGYDIAATSEMDTAEQVTLDQLYAESDIISLHVPLNAGTRHLINKDALRKMKDGVMLINTASGAVIRTTDVLAAIDSGKLGYLGLDVYEFENTLFYDEHDNSVPVDPLFEKLTLHPNVITTPRQAYLTREVLAQIAEQVIASLDKWESEPLL
jgi:D-lactate dehydrogenase